MAASATNDAKTGQYLQGVLDDEVKYHLYIFLY
jgi:hypothetical protein